MKIIVYGGMARHPAITPDGFAVVVCHEIGHHLGGAPKIEYSFGTSWASNEGQSDYFATTKCIRKFFAKDNNQAVIAKMDIDPTVKTYCDHVFKTKERSALCQRSSMASLSLAMLFQMSRRETVEPQFTTPDPMVVDKTNDKHPGTQCRLDTYFQGAICNVSEDISNDPTNPLRGTCSRVNHQLLGARPLCWYNPATKMY